MSSWLKGLTDQVQLALPKFDEGSILQSLTLTTPELTAERERIDAEEKRKERIRNALSGMLPWQTRDPERDILVEECKEAILLLSTNRETFFGPFPLPPMKAKSNDDSDELLTNSSPSNDSLEKLAKLQPLPPLLENFEFLAHVGLIEKVLKEDPNLVQMQSTLSGGGIREHIFWKNYFFHCAYTRYEAGLSIDEIWSEVPVEDTNQSPAGSKSNTPSTIPLVSTMAGNGDEVEETITFDEDKNSNVSDNATTNADHAPELFDHAVNATKPSPAVPSEPDYEMMDDDTLLIDSTLNTNNDGANDEPLDDGEYELDELEAEIARELED